MAQNLISILVFLIITVGMVSGFSTATTITFFLIILLYSLKTKLKNYLTYKVVTKHILLNWKLEFLFAIWCFLSCFWSISLASSLLTYVRVLFIILIGIIINYNIDNLEINNIKIKQSFIIGIITAIILFYIEYYSQGILSRTFRIIFQSNSLHIVHLCLLDRGCALLSTISWIMIGVLLYNDKYILSLLFYIMIFYILLISDSLASFVGFIISSLVFITSRLLVTKPLLSIFSKLITATIILGSLSMPIIAYKISPYDFIEKYTSMIQDSAKHRIFIWHFVSSKSIEKLVLGYGFSSSRNFIVEDNEMIDYKKYHWSPLPLHPHNNIMQILFETGLPGLILFLSLVYKYLQKINNIQLNSQSFRQDEFETTPCAATIVREQRRMAKNSFVSSFVNLAVALNNSKDYRYILNYRSIAYACFSNYYIISMISSSMWQLWWVCVAVFTTTLIRLIIKPS